MFSQSFKRVSDLNVNHWFSQLPPEIRAIVFSYLVKRKDIANASAVCTLFYREVSLSNNPALWSEVFIKLGYEKNLIHDLTKLKAINDYRNLYRVLNNLSTHMREDIKHVWQLLCISGEPNAIDIGIEKEIITCNERNPAKDNILYYCVLSGIPEQVDKVIQLNNEIIKEQENKIQPDPAASIKKPMKPISLETTFDQLNILHLAILSGRREQIEKILMLEKLYHFQLSRNVSKRNKHPLHLAVVSNFPEQVRAVMEIFEVNLNVMDNRGNSVIEYAQTEEMKNVLVEMKSQVLDNYRAHCV